MGFKEFNGVCVMLVGGILVLIVDSIYYLLLEGSIDLLFF